MSTRDDVVAALDGLTVDLGPDHPPAVIAATTRVPDNFAAFTAWPVWVATTWVTACATEEIWHVLVTLTAGVPDSWADEGDGLLWPVRDSLLKVGAVGPVEPVRLTIGDASQIVPALRFTLTT
jgi:hypothetical protein